MLSTEKVIFGEGENVKCGDFRSLVVPADNKTDHAVASFSSRSCSRVCARARARARACVCVCRTTRTLRNAGALTR